jgi:hypothetical protein
VAPNYLLRYAHDPERHAIVSGINKFVKDIGYARPWDWQILINGFIAERAYELGEIDTSLPLSELKRLSYIDYRARAADDDPTFSSLIRKCLPGMR